MQDDSHQAVAREIEALHRALTAWLSGDAGRSNAWFHSELAARLHDRFINVQPAGRILTRTGLLESLNAGYGQSPGFRIRIRNVAVHQHLADGAYLIATYEEYQRGARNSPRSQNARLSTAVFERTGAEKLIWRHVHETWLPDENHDPALFDF